MENLKPCPFCGGEAGVRIISMGGSGTGGNVHFKIQCKGCGATATSTTYVAMGKLGKGLEMEFAGTAMEKATEDWNWRARKRIKPMRVNGTSAYALCGDCGGYVGQCLPSYGTERSKFCPRCGAEVDWAATDWEDIK